MCPYTCSFFHRLKLKLDRSHRLLHGISANISLYPSIVFPPPLLTSISRRTHFLHIFLSVSSPRRYQHWRTTTPTPLNDVAQHCSPLPPPLPTLLDFPSLGYFICALQPFFLFYRVFLYVLAVKIDTTTTTVIASRNHSLSNWVARSNSDFFTPRLISSGPNI